MGISDLGMGERDSGLVLCSQAYAASAVTHGLKALC